MEYEQHHYVSPLPPYTQTRNYVLPHIGEWEDAVAKEDVFIAECEQCDQFSPQAANIQLLKMKQ